MITEEIFKQLVADHLRIANAMRNKYENMIYETVRVSDHAEIMALAYAAGAEINYDVRDNKLNMVTKNPVSALWNGETFFIGEQVSGDEMKTYQLGFTGPKGNLQ